MASSLSLTVLWVGSLRNMTSEFDLLLNAHPAHNNFEAFCLFYIIVNNLLKEANIDCQAIDWYELVFVPVCLWCLKPSCASNYIFSTGYTVYTLYQLSWCGSMRRGNKPRSYHWRFFLFQGQKLYSVLWSTQVGQHSVCCLQCKMWSLSSHSTENCFLHHNMQQEIHFIHFWMENAEDEWKERVYDVAANMFIYIYLCLWELQRVVHFMQGCWFDPQLSEPCTGQ